MTNPPLYPTAQIRAIEQAREAAGLMEKAGLAAATLARDLLGGDEDSILVVAGPGNNGGDALVAARHLRQCWLKLTVVFTGQRNQLPPDAAQAYDAWLACGGTVETDIPAYGKWHLVIDGLFGIGLQRPLDGRYAALVQRINTLGSPVLALDMPSGLCADTGRVLGCAVEADHTLTFLGLKPGLFTLEGPDHAGLVHTCDLGVENVPAPPGVLMQQPCALPPPRRRDSHKGSYGSVAVLGGAESMVGAAILAARAALLTGAGRVYAGLLAPHAPAVDMRQPELMLRSSADIFKLDAFDVLVAGPGMGPSTTAGALLEQALHHPAMLVLDADALNLLAASAELRARLTQRKTGTTVITPHPGEAATLLHVATADIQADRIQAASELATTFNATAVLKGCGSIVATTNGHWFINASGNPGLAAAGMGDVLAGIIGGLVAQGMDAESATLLGVHLHGAAADQLVADGTGPAGLTASEVALKARNLLNQWMHSCNHN